MLPRGERRRQRHSTSPPTHTRGPVPQVAPAPRHPPAHELGHVDQQARGGAGASLRPRLWFVPSPVTLRAALRVRGRRRGGAGRHGGCGCCCVGGGGGDGRCRRVGRGDFNRGAASRRRGAIHRLTGSRLCLSGGWLGRCHVDLATVAGAAPLQTHRRTRPLLVVSRGGHHTTLWRTRSVPAHLAQQGPCRALALAVLERHDENSSSSAAAPECCEWQTASLSVSQVLSVGVGAAKL